MENQTKRQYRGNPHTAGCGQSLNYTVVLSEVGKAEGLQPVTTASHHSV